MSLIQSLSGQKRESSVWNYFKFEKGLNKSRCSTVDEKEKRRVKCGLWAIKELSKLRSLLKLELKLELK